MTRAMKKDELRYPGAHPAVWLIGLYILSRLCFFAAGVRFDLEPIATSWQILDPVLLRENLAESLFYMPGQPPLYNLIIGWVLKLGNDPLTLTIAFRTLYSAMAITSVLLLYSLVHKLTDSVKLAFGVATLFMLTPALVLYEAIPYYTLMILSLLGTIAWLFHLCMERFTFARAFAMFLAMAALIYTRSMFQWQWFVVLALFCALVLPGYRKAVFAAAVIPLALVFALYGKNVMVTGHFATSDWMGMSLSKLTTLAIDKPERQRLVDAGELSDMALMDFPFNTPEAYADIFDDVEPTGITVLDQKRKSTGHVNYNHLAYADVSEQALEDAIASVRIHPEVYLQSMGTAWLMFMRPSSDYPFLQDNRAAIEPYSRVFSLLLAGQPKYPTEPKFDLEAGQIGILVAIGYTLAVLYGLYLLIRCAIKRRVSAVEATLIFLWLNIMYVSVIGNAFEVDENQRFRFSVNPFIAATLAVMATRALNRVRGRDSL
ncbi:hypothetical protein SSPSH_000099 [Salinisphaera shabanensis E1L3A]|uniref:Glycosyltransferase RgtA/B/C/D-like domain-containing protein n=2 Tax=Salinisphaera shabanensis TaxID=180542 RepID=U2ERY4_9GAMM|nr:hypothetical protein SSPSH_000099 [Salinisphaera shabanensis E1L3A]